MENKRNTSLYVTIGILLVLALGGYVVYNKFFDDKNFVSKLDDSKEWVYNAEYEKNVSVDSYNTMDGITYYAKDIVVPFINVDSSYANISNNEIKEVFNDVITEYNNGVSDKMTYIDECNYQKYIKDNILSVILTYGIGATDIVQPQYYTYNIDLNSGNKLSYQEVYKIAGFDSNNIDSKVESAITAIIQEELKNYTFDMYPNGTNFDTYNNESINNYRNSVSNNTLRYYLSDNGKLNVIVKLIIPIGAFEFDTIITID